MGVTGPKRRVRSIALDWLWVAFGLGWIAFGLDWVGIYWFGWNGLALSWVRIGFRLLGFGCSVARFRFGMGWAARFRFGICLVSVGSVSWQLGFGCLFSFVHIYYLEIFALIIYLVKD